MQRIWHMAIKDLLLIRRDPIGLFFIIGFPILMGLFFGLVFNSMSSGTPRLTVAVVDEDDSPISQKFVASLEANESLVVTKHEREKAQELVRKGELAGMIALPQGFGETAGIFWEEQAAIDVGVDPSRQAERAMLQGLVMQAMGELAFTRFSNPGEFRPLVQEAKAAALANDELPLVFKGTLPPLFDSLDSFLASWEEELASDAIEGETSEEDVATSGPGFQLATINDIDVTREVTPGSQEDLAQRIRSSWDISFPQSMVWGLLGCAAGFAITLVRERKQGTLLRLQVSPASRGEVLISKGLACFLAVLTVIAVMLALGVALGMRPESPLLLAMAAVCTAVCFVGLMMLMATLGKTEEAVSGAGWGICVVMAMFGGGMIPLAFMPNFMATLSNFSPVKWTVLAVEGAIWRGFSFAEMLLPCGILLAIGILATAIGVRVFQRVHA